MEFEVVFRSTMAYHLAEKYGPNGYLDPNIYLRRTGGDGLPLRTRLIEEIRGDIRRSTERFVQHHRQQGADLPIWAAVEVLSLGAVSKMYGLLDNTDLRRQITQRFAIKHNVSTGTFRSMSILRNVCAHHSRIWNRTHGIELEAPRVAQGSDDDAAIYKNTPWAWIVTLGHIVDAIRDNDSYSESIWKLVDGVSNDLLEGLMYPKDVSLASIFRRGFVGVGPSAAPVETTAAPRPGNLRADGNGASDGPGVMRQAVGIAAVQTGTQRVFGGSSNSNLARTVRESISGRIGGGGQSGGAGALVANRPPNTRIARRPGVTSFPRNATHPASTTDSPGDHKSFSPAFAVPINFERSQTTPSAGIDSYDSVSHHFYPNQFAPWRSSTLIPEGGCRQISQPWKQETYQV